jgi:phosphoglycerate dehydrogenase-like enzyme
MHFLTPNLTAKIYPPLSHPRRRQIKNQNPPAGARAPGTHKASKKRGDAVVMHNIPKGYHFTMAKFIIALVSLLAASASAFTAPQQHAFRSSSLMMTTESGARDPIKVGVIGCGRIGIVHLGAINKAPGVIPVVVSNPTVSKAEDGKVYQCCI